VLRGIALVLVLSGLCAAHFTGRPALAARALTAQEEASVVAKQAMDYYASGQFALAAELYRKAFRIHPTQTDYLFGVARSEQRLGRVAESRAAFQQLLAVLPASDPLTAKARQALDAMKLDEEAKARAVAPPAKPAEAATPKPRQPAAESAQVPDKVKPADVQPKPVETSAPPAAVKAGKVEEAPKKPAQMPTVAIDKPGVGSSGGSRRTAGWAAAAGGVVLAIAAGTMAGAAASDESWLDGHDARNITRKQAISSQESINKLWTGAAVSGGVAVAAGALGAWLLGSTPPRRAALLPQPGGVALAIRF